MSDRFFLYTSLFLGLVSSTLAKVPLYYQPDLSEPSVTSLSIAELENFKIYPVLDEQQAAQGWRWVEYPGTYTGYVKTDNVTKQLKVEPATLVYRSPTEESPVLGILQEDDTYEVNRGDTDFAGITFSKAIPLYFLQDAANRENLNALNAPIAQQAPAPPGDFAPAPVTAPLPDSDPETLETLDVFGSEADQALSDGTSEAPRIKPPRDIFTQFSGVFKLEKDGIFKRKPREVAGLYSPDGKKRLAWLNLDALVTTLPLTRYHDRSITLQGIIIDSSYSKHRTIEVRHIQIVY